VIINSYYETLTNKRYIASKL